jgi:replicative DNA helicase
MGVVAEAMLSRVLEEAVNRIARKVAEGKKLSDQEIVILYLDIITRSNEKRFETTDKRFNDLREYTDKRFESLEKRIEDLRSYVNKRINDLKRILIRSLRRLIKDSILLIKESTRLRGGSSLYITRCHRSKRIS